ncbi:restriction endonuclease [Halomonas sp. MMSF_3323]|uniref:restriction endonuclease n=1 Tax=Halomonas sp. MMSF_3323 TaxID=3046701 RepID=UPI00273D5ABC|nr:restriction endonuclease [Halomonas sp. MMSF_3323]
MEIEIDIDRVSAALSHSKALKDLAVRYHELSIRDGIFPWNLAYVAQKSSYDLFFDDPTGAYIDFFLDRKAFNLEVSRHTKMFGLRSYTVNVEKYIDFILFAKILQSYAFARVWSDRVFKDAEVLLNDKSNLVEIDEFGDKSEARWKRRLLKYANSKYRVLVEKYVSDNFFEVLDFGRSVVGERYDYSLSCFDKEMAYDPFFSCWIEFVCEWIELKRCDDETLHEDFLANPPEHENMLDIMSGWEFEKYLAARINNETTMHAEVTKGSGDQGADLIVKGIGLSAVIQAKHYSSKVGNKAVQEAFSARQYYGTGLAIVVANAGYTKSAWQLAEKTGVLAMTEASILDLLKVLSR